MARKQKNIHYIYKTICSVTGKWYIGMHSTNNLDDGYMGSGKILRYSIRKYGVENHTKEILEFFETREELVLREQEIVNKELIGDGKCMNLKEGGNGGFISDEQQRYRSECGGKALHKKIKDDIIFNEEYRKKISVGVQKAMDNGKMRKIQDNFSWVGLKKTEKSKKKTSETMKGTGTGETNSQYGTCWITKDGINKKIKKEDLETYLNDGWLKGRK